MKLSSRLLHAFLRLSVALLLPSIFLTGMLLYRRQVDQAKEGLRHEVLALSQLPEEERASVFSSLVSGKRRLSWIAADGHLLYDSALPSSRWEVNHLDREEVRKALHYGEGSSIRSSESLMLRYLYVARRLDDGSVLRLSLQQESPLGILLELLPPLLAIFFFVLLWAVALSQRLRRRIVEPLEQLASRVRSQNELGEEETYEEIQPFLTQLRLSQEAVQRQFLALWEERRRFSEISNNLQEVLILLDAEGRILHLNPAACHFLGTSPAAEGQLLRHILRDPSLQKALDSLLSSASSQEELRLEREGRIYQLSLHVTSREGAPIGFTLLAVDSTERIQAESRRREFTANVSHELKTPLQTVIGSAELLEQGFVQTEDLPLFARRIREEGQRLLHLIDDMIRLSALDEGRPFPRELCSLLDLSREVFARLEVAAQRREVKLISSTRDYGRIWANRPLLHEILYNLVENAIKYNREGGEVHLDWERTEEGKTWHIRVRDEGPGIPEDQQEQIFERFYRLEHTSTVPGTGLGLSIVKRAVLSHQGHIRVESRPGKGTCFLVDLPVGEDGVIP